MNDITPIEDLIAIATKSTWIAAYGSPELQSIYNAGYECEEAYAIERIKFDYPGFQLAPGFRYDRADSPHPYIFAASLEYPESYCFAWVNITGLAIDDYLGKHQIFKRIEIPKQAKEKVESGSLVIQQVKVEPLATNFVNEKEDWIFTCGSEQLREAYLNGYECEIGYVEDRIIHDHPGFEISKCRHDRMDTPSQHALKTCLAYQDDNAYICEWGGSEYIFIPNYLGTHSIWKMVEDEIIEYNSPASSKIATSRKCETNHFCRLTAILTAIAIPLMLIRLESHVRHKIPAVFSTPSTLPLMIPDPTNPLLFDR